MRPNIIQESYNIQPISSGYYYIRSPRPILANCNIRCKLIEIMEVDSATHFIYHPSIKVGEIWSIGLCCSTLKTIQDECESNELWLCSSSTTNKKGEISMINKIKDEIENIKNKSTNTVWNYTKKAVLGKMKSHFTRQETYPINVGMDNKEKNPIIKFLFKYNPNIKKYIVPDPLNSDRWIIHDYIGLFKIRNDTYCLVKMGKYIINENDFIDYLYTRDGSDRLDNNRRNNVCITVFGKGAIYIINYLTNALQKYERSRREKELMIFNVQEKNKDLFITRKKIIQRNFDSLFFRDRETTASIISLLDKYNSNDKVYSDRNLLHKTGILLYGEGGTGKSTLCNAISTYMKTDMIMIDMTSFQELDLIKLTEILNVETDKTYVIVLEDIDCIIKDRDGDKDIDKEENRAINKLLQFLDSNNSPNNAIFVATTNHVEKLDKAIRRKGRFDLELEVKRLNRDNAIRMCKSFNLDNDQITEVLSRFEDHDNIKQSSLQAEILSVIEVDV